MIALPAWTELELSEKKALEVFGKLGYGYAYGPEIAPDGPKAERESFKEVVLTGRLAKAIKKFNPWISDNNLKKAMREITHVEARNLVEANSIIHEKLVRHISLAQDLGEGKKKQTVRFIDWEKPERNEFLVVNQFMVAGPKENIIPDIVVFVNGIPFGVIECKNPTTYEPEEKAIKQLLRYQNLREPDTHEGAERLFYPNQVVVAAWSESASCCTVGGWYNHYRMWKDPYPITEKELKDFLGRKPKGQDILIYSIFRKDHLLDLVRNFIVFEPEGEALVKKLARYQQFRAVNKAIAAIEKSKEWKGGTIWHTQGSGKSLSMLYLAVKLRRMKKLENPVIVIMTDRKDLDKQITGTFERCGFPNPERATSIVDLRDRLSAGPGVTTMTTIQKFQERVEGQHPVLSKASNIFVMVDEAHRSQYKDLATNVRTALPNARYLAFTGTPIEQRKRNTRQTFGDYIDTYTIEESVADGATVPIHYQGRLADVWVEGRNLDEIFDRVFADKSKKERELIKQRYANEKTIAEARERIKQICLDLIKHYETVIAPNGFKAQVVTVSREAAATYKEILDELNGPESAVIISGDHNDPERLKKHHLTDQEQERLLKRFKKPMDEDGLSLLIVCDMLLTGFDAPIEQAMYLDKPLKEHNLLQAIARVNRPYKEKNHGLIIDYYGVSAFLKQALAVFSKRDVQGALTPLTDELPRLQSRHRAAMRFFEGVNRKDLDACVSVLEPEDVRLKFDVAFRRFAESMDMVMPDPAANPYREDLKFLGMVRNAARNRFRDENINLAGCGEKVRKLINEHIRASGVDPLHKPVSILEKDFEKTIDDIRSDEAKASEMEHAIRHEIRVRIDENPVFYSSLKERLEEIIKDRKKERMALSLAIEEYGKIITEIRGLSKKARSLGLNETEYAFYELLKVELKAKKKAGKEGKAGKPREGEEKNGFAALAKELVSMLGDLAVVDWKTRDDVQRQMRSRIKRKLKSFGCDKDKLDKVTARVMELAKVRL